MTKTRLAKAVYAVSCAIARIKTPQQTYEVTNMEEVFENKSNIVVKKLKRAWLPCNLSNRLMIWSLNLDPMHWDHWALEHKGCYASYCMDCKGYVCERDDQEL